MVEKTNNKTIAKNTIYLYFRMIITMLISLYTSRVILQKLGVEDYGIYQAVGGIVGFLSFINSGLSTGSSRFITFALGEDSSDRLKRTFSTSLNIHIVLALIIVLIAETVGQWFLFHKMIIPADRMDAAVFTYHMSIIAVVFTLTQVPFNATIIAHEKMSIYAYVSVVDVSAKLAISYLLSLVNYDKLMVYSTLLCFVQISLLCFYWLYCRNHFVEARFSFSFDKKIFKEMSGFSSWSLSAGAVSALNNQGVLLLLNIFFTPTVVASRAISLQVNAAANQFVSNFRQAANPQIVKKYAAMDFEGSKHLLLESTKYSYYLMYMLSLPICILAQPLLLLWLGFVPEYAVPFLQLVIIQSLFQVFDTSFYTALYANGRLKENVLTSSTLFFLIFPITYVFFKLGYSPLVLSWASLVVYAILGCIQKPLMIIKIINYTWKDIWSVFRPCIIVTALSLPIPIYLSKVLDCSKISNFIFMIIVTVIIIGIMVFFFGIDKETRVKIFMIIKKHIS